MKHSNTFIAIGAFFGMSSVILGAFGAHALKEQLSPVMLQTYHTAVQYQMYHALALIVIGTLLAIRSDNLPSTPLRRSAISFMLGILLFSGSLYALTLSSLILDEHLRWLGMITPFGGTFFIIGWGFLLSAVIKAPKT